MDILWTAVLVWLPLVALIAVAVAFSLLSGVPMRDLMQDSTTVAQQPFYIGSYNLLGVIGWSLAVAICLFPVIALAQDVTREWRRYLLIAGLLTAVLLLDDAFLIHDEILPGLGISGELYGFVYIVTIVTFLAVFRAVIATTNIVLLGVALLFFSVSAASDLGSTLLTEQLGSRSAVLLEDGAKLLGIGSWLAYFVTVARQAVQTRFAAGS